ncbi:hypothetical protein DFH09DRAFT_1194638 [Mycena vulgaris]|nr:hypothetical protein DFH09DRAFT_1194638 [Mycena vulgaris]
MLAFSRAALRIHLRASPPSVICRTCLTILGRLFDKVQATPLTATTWYLSPQFVPHSQVPPTRLSRNPFPPFHASALPNLVFVSFSVSTLSDSLPRASQCVLLKTPSVHPSVGRLRRRASANIWTWALR